VLVNSTFEQLLFIVNGESHRLSAGEVKELGPMTPGQVEYEAISPTRGTRGRFVTTLVAGKQLTLTAQ
jgi:hypothetical protein